MSLVVHNLPEMATDGPDALSAGLSMVGTSDDGDAGLKATIFAGI